MTLIKTCARRAHTKKGSIDSLDASFHFIY